MSKHLLEALGAIMHPVLTQTVDTCTCDRKTPMALDIRLMDLDEHGNATAAKDVRYVRMSDSSGKDQIIPMRLQHGEAYVRLEDVEAAQFTLVQSDACGNQLMNGDHYAITYQVNQQIQEEDYARGYGSDGCNEIIITNRPAIPVCLTITKALYNEFHEPMDFQNDMCFTIHVEGCGICETIDLNMDNGFQYTLDHLKAGSYEIYEEEKMGWAATYALNGELPDSVTTRSLCPGAHTLEVINTRCSSSVLTLDKYIRDASGELIKPQKDECFHVRIISDYYDQIFELNGANDFALDLCDLPAGLYDVMELDANGYEVSYLVNASPESNYANVEVKDCTSASVLIINSVRTCVQESPLRICKYVRRSDDCLVKPDPNESFKVMLSGCGVCEIFNLNAGNNFCVDMEHICCGEYEVRELDHDGYVASYMVNDDGESTSAHLWIHEGGHNCVTIINEERNKGEVTICKVIRQKDGTFSKPDKTARFLITLRSFFCRETFVLDANNDFCVHVVHLKEGSYEVKERCVEGYDTTYTVDGGREEKKARFVVMNGCNTDIKVINSVKREISGDLRICKYISNTYGDYVKPSVDEEFEIHVQGPCLDECYWLRSANNWCIVLEGLKKGVYRIEEHCDSHYETQYFVNGCEMEDNALVCMERSNQEVSIVNTKCNNGNLKLAVLVEDCCNELRKPNRSEFFDVIVETATGSREIRLDERNNFGVLLDNLPESKVRITQKDSYGYRVTYEVDGERQNNALVQMCGKNHTVTIINQVIGCAGILRVRKLVETLHGKIVAPCDDDCYTFTLRSRCMEHEFTLSAQNDFCILFDDLEEDVYEIEEACVKGMETEYRVNGEVSKCARFTLQRDDVEVEVINRALPLPTLCVHKRIKKCGTLMKPQECDSFDFQLIGRGVHETYCLNQENDWSVCLDGLCNQHYEIRECNSNCHTMYQINDRLSEQGTFLFDDEDIEVTIINDAGSDALVNICKQMRELDGTLVPPCREDSFDVVIENDCFRQCICLNEANHWMVQVAGLAEGTYTIKELGSDSPYEIWVDDCCSKDGSFTLDDQDIDIMLVNPLGCDNALIISASAFIDEIEELPAADTAYHIHVTHEGVCDSFTLDASNEWCIELANICLGTYRIVAEECVLYESCGQCYENCIDIEIGCEKVYVSLLDEHCSRRSISITKRIQDEQGRLHKPPCGSRFSIILQGIREECFDLCEENDWNIQLWDYPKGRYQIEEAGCAQATFLIDGKKQDKGTFTLRRDAVEIVVVNSANEEAQPCAAGTLVVHAMVKNCDGDLETAPADAAFDVMIDGDNVREDITLTHRNGFQMAYPKLPEGPYVITQQPNPAYTRITYRIHGVEQPSGEITLGKDDLHVDIINYKNCDQGSIHVMKYIKDASCGCLKRPCMDETFTITVHGDQIEQSVILNSSNKWSYVFEGLRDGMYTIQEEMNDGTTYIVNGGKEQKEAVIKVSGKDANVKVINPSAESVQGSIEVCKYMRDENGTLHDPEQTSSYWVSVSGEGITQRVLLHSANHFYAEIRHLLPGMYEVHEEDGTGVVYTVNGGKESDRAVVSVNKNHTSVNIINPIQINGTITLVKYLQAADGSLTIPRSGSYRVHVSAPGYNTVITLNEQNHFTKVLDHLRRGMYVIDELDHDDVTYIIDGGSQVDRAVVNVTGTHDVSLINPQKPQSSGVIRLTKYLRRTNGQLIRPNGDAAYRFHVSKPGFNEVYTLDQHNHWSITIDHLEDGNYVISELDGDADVSYIINDGSETDFGIVAVHGNENNVSVINRETVSNGSITITKYMRSSAGELTRPSGDFSTSVHISRPGYNEVVTLNQANQWEIKLLDLLDGDYVLSEVDSDDEVTWRINGGYEVRYAIVNVSHNENQVDMIDTKQAKGNTLHLQKFIRNTAGQLVQPQDNESFSVLISGTATMRVELNAANRWMAHLENLENGTYHIKEVSNHYDVTYMINDEEERNSATVVLKDNSASVGVINAMRGSRNLLEITKYIKTANGTLIPPVAGDRFQVEVSGPSYQQIYTLEDSNRFSVRIANLSSGTYTVRELTADDYVTTYRVNGGQETSSAILTVSEGKNNVVETINERKADQNIVEVYKYMMDEQGNFRKPLEHQVFRFLLSGNNVHQFYTLSSANRWYVRIDTLASGEYEIIEQGNGQYQVQYLVNGTDFSSTGEFVAAAGNETIVEIVNSDLAQKDGAISLEKKVRNSDGDLIIPGNGESFSVRVINQAAAYDETFTLDELNAYTLKIDQLSHGTYTIEEIDNNGYGVTYIVNDQQETSSALVNVQNDTIQNVLIINTQTSLFFHVATDDDLHVVIE